MSERCRQCGRDVEPGRESYATPTCYQCLPPPAPLPVNYTLGHPWRVRWTEDGDIDCRATADAVWLDLLKMSSPVALVSILRRVCFEVWTDAYTHGWSDGRADRNPDQRPNPYKVTP